MSRKSDVFIAFLAGAGVGAALGILFAPDKGVNTREKLSTYLEKYKDKLKELIKEYTEGKNEASPENSSTSNETYSNSDPSIMTEAKSEGMKVVKDARAQAEALLNDVEDLIYQINRGKKV